jgi:hypothetical protein
MSGFIEGENRYQSTLFHELMITLKKTAWCALWMSSSIDWISQA